MVKSYAQVQVLMIMDRMMIGDFLEVMMKVTAMKMKIVFRILPLKLWYVLFCIYIAVQAVKARKYREVRNLL